MTFFVVKLFTCTFTAPVYFYPSSLFLSLQSIFTHPKQTLPVQMTGGWPLDNPTLVLLTASSSLSVTASALRLRVG